MEGVGTVGRVAWSLTSSSQIGCPFWELEELGSGQAEALVLAGDGACRVLVTDFIFNKSRFVTLVSQ